MAKRKIVWTIKAKNEFAAALKFYSHRNGNKKYSQKIRNETISSIEKLVSFIYLGRPTNENNIRVLVKDHFKIFYKIRPLEIIILVIWDSRRNPIELKPFLN